LTDGWQFLLTTYPWTSGDAGSGPVMVDYDIYGNLLRNASSTPNAHARMPPVCIYTGPGGNNLGPFELAVAGNVQPVGLGLDNNYAKGSHRVIGWGVEVYDTTAVIARQGTCTVFRQNTNTYNKSTHLYQETPDTLKGIGAISGISLNRPPNSIAEANLLAGTRSWKSEDGCYLVMTQNQEQLLAKQPDDTQPIFYSGDVAPGFRGTVPSHVISGSTYAVPAGENNAIVPSMVWNMQPYHMSGCFFTGLSHQSTFLIRTVFYVERFPTPDEKDIVLLTKPSACHDPVALEIYDRMLKEMPVGVPVAENGLGEWFYQAIKAVAPALSAIPHPLAQAGAGIANAVMAGMDANSKPKQQARKTLPRNRGRQAPPPQRAPRAAPQPPARNNQKRKKKRPSSAQSEP
jgi:hypothetical protein